MDNLDQENPPLNFPKTAFDAYMENMSVEVAKLAQSSLERQLQEAVGIAQRPTRPPGRPRKPLELLQAHEFLSPTQSSVSCNGDSSDSTGGLPAPPRNETYVNWFTPDLWPRIAHALSQSNSKAVGTVSYLQRRWPSTPTIQGPYHRLNESTVRGWFLLDGRTFKPTIRCAIDTLTLSGKPADPRSIAQGVVPSLWKGKIALEDEWQSLLRHQRDSGQVVNSVTTQILLKGFLMAKCPEVLKKNGGPFSCSRSYVTRYLRKVMGWTFRASTTNASKLPRDWQLQGDMLAMRMAYLVKAHGIPPQLVVNADQTGLALVPCAGERTYSRKGSREVSITGRDDKRAITVVPSVAASGHLLPFQLVFEGKTRAVIPQSPAAILVTHQGWVLSKTHNHWSNLATTKEWINDILRPYHLRICKELGLHAGKQKCVLLLDCWSVHKSAEFRSWMSNNHPNIVIIYVPAGCTSKLQPCDVIVQRPLKCQYQRQYHDWAIAQISAQFSAGVTPQSSRVDLAVGTLRVKAVEWLHQCHIRLTSQVAMLKKGWSHCLLLRAWEEDFQEEAFSVQEKGQSLFASDPTTEGGLEPEPPLGPVLMEWDGEHELEAVIEECTDQKPIVDLNEVARTEAIGNDRLFDFTEEAEDHDTVNFTQYLTDPYVTTPYGKE